MQIFYCQLLIIRSRLSEQVQTLQMPIGTIKGIYTSNFSQIVIKHKSLIFVNSSLIGDRLCSFSLIEKYFAY